MGPTQGQFNQSLNINVTEQLALLETTADDRKLTVPSHRFEISEVTDHSKLFKDDLTNPTNTELSHIQINFSTLQPANQDDNDDLDAIERDLEYSQPNVVCPGPFSNRGDVSQYIEFDLNMTQGPLRCTNESDMSITETIQSPKKELSNVDINKPVASWVENKENIVVNPYVAPDEGENFAVHASPEKVLVFDGKKLKYETIDTDLDELVDAKSSLPNKSLQNRSFEGKKVLYADLDSPVGSETNLALNRTSGTNKTLLYSDNADLGGNMSMTGVINVADIKNHTKVYDLDDGEMSMTKCVAKTQNLNKEVDLVVTQALTNMLKESFEIVSESKFYEQKALKDRVEAEAKSGDIGESKKKRQTIVFSENEGDISMTACVPNEVLAGLGNKTEASFDMSMTKAIPNNLIESLPQGNIDEVEICSVNMTAPEIGPIDSRKSLGNEIIKTDGLNVSGNMSMTRVLPNKIITDFVSENKMDDESDVSSVNMSMTKPVPNKIVTTYATQDAKPEEIELSDVNMSVTKVIPNEIIKNILAEEKIADKENYFAASATKLPVDNRSTNAMDISDVNMSITKAIPHDLLAKLSEYTIPVKDAQKPDADVSAINMSMTKAIPTNVISTLATKTDKLEEIEALVSTNKRRKTIIFQDADISMTQAIPVNFIEEIREKTVISSTSLLSDLASEHFSYAQSNRKTVDIHEKSARSISTERSVKKTIYSEETTVDVSNQTLAVSRNITKIISRQMSPEFQRSKSPKLLEPHKPSVTESRLARSRSPKSPMTSPNKSHTQPSRYSFGKRSNSSRSTSPDRDHKLLNLDKFGEKKRRSHSPEAHNTSRNTSLGTSRKSFVRGSMNPFSNPSKATSPDEPSIPKKAIKPYQIHNKATSPEKLDFGVVNQSNREVLVYQAVAPINPKDKTSGSSTCGETTTTSSSTESLTTSTDHFTSSTTKTTTTSSDNQESAGNIDKTQHFHNQSIAIAIESEVSESQRKNAPSSKGDEFQKSSQKLYGQPGINKLENPQLERRKTLPIKPEAEVPINTIAYDQLDNISKKSVKTSLVYTEHGCQPDAVPTPELVSETTSFHLAQKKSESKDISLTAVATMRETSCDPMSQEFVLEQPKLHCTVLNKDIGLDPPSGDAILLKRSPSPLTYRITETGTQKTPSDKSLSSYVESGRMAFTALQSSTSNESCKTLTDEMTSEDEPHKPSETSTRTLLNNLLDMSDVSLPTNCAEVGKSFKASNFNKTVCDVTSSPKAHLSALNDDRKRQENSTRHSPLKNIITDAKKRITFNEHTKQRTYEPPTDSDTYDSRDGLVQSGSKRNPLLNKYFGRNQAADESDSTVTDEKPSKLLDIISILTHPDPDVLTSTSSEDPGSAKKIKFNLVTDTEDTSQVSIVNDGKFIHVQDTSSQDTDMTALTKPAYGFSDHSTNKSNVIPSRYYDDVAENVNDLMKDLVKPRSDGYPFEDVPYPTKPYKSPSICSTQVQATLATSSQVDLDVLPYESMYELTHVCQENVTTEKRLKGIIKPRVSDENLNTDMEDEYESVTLKLQKHQCDRKNDRVLVFDKNNPLNNIMIAPIDFKEAHEYHPESEVETSETEENEMAVNAVRIQPRSPSLISEVQLQSEEKNASVKDTEVNTVVAMKGTKELLDANSSLTLVEEQVVRRSTDTDLLGQKKKRLQVLFKSSGEGQENNLEKTFLGNIVPDVIPEPKSPNKSKITSWLQQKSPKKSPQRSPRSPTINIPKCSLSPKSKHGTPSKTSQEDKPKHKKKRQRSPITVQQLITQIGDPSDTELMNKQLLRAMQENLPVTSSDSDIESQNNSLPKSMEFLNSSMNSISSSIKHSGSVDSKRRSEVSALKSLTSKSDWQPELLSDMSSKNLIAECDSSTNVVVQIAMLPFMG